MQHVVTVTTLDPLTALPRLLTCGRALRTHPYAAGGEFPAPARYGVVQITVGGAGEIHDREGVFRLGPGQAFLAVVPDREVVWRSCRESREGWTFFWVSFAGGCSLDLVSDLIARNGRVQAIDLSDPVVQRIRQIAEVPDEGHILSAADGARLVDGLLLGLLEAGGFAPEVGRGRYLVRRMLDLIRTRLDGSLNVADLALALGISREHLSRVCRRHLGMSPNQCLREERLQRACRLLRTTAMSNKELASVLGLSSAGHFARIFRKGRGVSPGSYRQRIQGQLH